MELGTNGTGDGLIKETTTQGFAPDVIEESHKQPVMVDFWAPWCGPCRQLTPLIEKAVQDAGGRVKLVKMNIDDHPEIPGQMGVQSIPAVVAFKDGRPIDGFMGAVPESQIKSFIDKIAEPAGPSETDLLIEEAKKLLDAQEFDAAAQHFNAVLQSDQGNGIAIAGLAACALGLGEAEKAQQILAMMPEEQKEDPFVMAITAQMELMEKAADTGEIDQLNTRVAENPDNHQARFDLALALNAAGNREEAADALLNIVARDRNWEDDGARKELLKFFEAWGPTDKSTIATRRKLSSLLFS